MILVIWIAGKKFTIPGVEKWDTVMLEGVPAPVDGSMGEIEAFNVETWERETLSFKVPEKTTVTFELWEDGSAP